MALTATLHNFSIDLADVDRGVYQSFELRVARHPSETAEFMLTRVLAYCLEWCEGIELSQGVGALDEPAVLVRNLTGTITAWIEVGTPDAKRLHRGSKLAERTAVYTHRDPSQFLAQLAKEKIHRASEIPIYSFGRGIVEAAAGRLERRGKLTLSVSGRQLYLDVHGEAFSTEIEEHRLV